MTSSFLEKIAFGVSGTTALAIGSFIATLPHAFYAGYGIALGPEASLLSEIRAMGAGLAALGGVMLSGIWLPRVRSVAVAAAMIVFLAFPAGRLVGIAIDGWPAANLVGALAFELAVAALCLVAFRHRLGRSGPSPTRSQRAH